MPYTEGENLPGQGELEELLTTGEGQAAEAGHRTACGGSGARRLGVHISVAATWQRASAGDWTAYAAGLGRC